MERDRRGGLRVFQGQALPRTTAAPQGMPSSVEIVDVENDAIEPGNAAPIETERSAYTADIEADIIDEAQPAAVVDTTAELLGRATSKRAPRTRAAAPPKTRKAPEKKTAGRRTGRGRRPKAQEPVEQ
jgi:hypothetical protein